MTTTSLMALLAALALTACGLSTHGGIVDNGNKPDDDMNVPNPMPSDDPASAVPVTAVNVLSHYAVDVPNAWTVDTALESAILRFKEHTVLFLESSKACDAVPVMNPFGVAVYACTATKTVLHLGGTMFIVAKHDERNADIDQVLNSFRRK